MGTKKMGSLKSEHRLFVQKSKCHTQKNIKFGSSLFRKLAITPLYFWISETKSLVHIQVLAPSLLLTSTAPFIITRNKMNSLIP